MLEGEAHAEDRVNWNNVVYRGRHAFSGLNQGHVKWPEETMIRYGDLVVDKEQWCHMHYS